MENLKNIFTDIIRNESLIGGIFSGKRSKEVEDYEKVRIEPVILKETYKIQFVYEYRNKVLHENLDKEEAIEKMYLLAYDEFKNINLFLVDKDLEVLISKKRKVKINDRKASKKLANLNHNKTKNYILEDNIEHDFLVELGVMDKNFKVKPSRYDKFRQINRFLELVEDVIDKLDGKKEINIIDFGCGKSYLTFALYYYLVDVLKLNINVIGLDLKKDVIEFCNETAEKLNYDKLKFIHGDIKDFDEVDKVDMVVTLHACDIATDAALVKAISWDAEVILSVPCCQAEFYSKVENPNLEPMLRHGIIKEKMSSLITDSLRGVALESLGYNVQLLEFIDIEHTPKNILIRGYKDPKKDRDKHIKEYLDFKEFWNLDDLFLDGELKKINKEIK